MKLTNSILLSMCIALAACGSKSSNSSSEAAPPAQPSPTPAPPSGGGGSGNSPHSFLRAEELTKKYIKLFAANSDGLNLVLNRYAIFIDMFAERVEPNDAFEVRISSCSGSSLLNKACSRLYVLHYRTVVSADYKNDIVLEGVTSGLGTPITFQQKGNWFNLSIPDEPYVQVAFDDLVGLSEPVTTKAKPSAPGQPGQKTIPSVGPLAPLPPFQGLDEGAKVLCERYGDGYDVNTCANDLRNLAIDPLALKLCNAYGDPYDARTCLKELAGKAFSLLSMTICDGFSDPYDKKSCALAIGSYEFDPTDVELCSKYSDAYEQRNCLSEKMRK